MTRGQKDQQLTDELVVEAMKRSGYPLEVRLLDALAAMGIDGSPGQRVRIGGGKSIEVDVVAVLRRDLPFDDGPRRRTLRVEIVLLIEAKALESDGALVMLPWTSPAEEEMKARRLRWGGAPRMNDLDGKVVEAVAQAAAGSFQAIDEKAAFCVQWATVRRQKDKNAPFPFAANHDDGFWRGLEGVATAAAIVARGTRIGLERPEELHVQVPLSLFVYAGRLYGFDRQLQQATALERCVLDRTFDTGHGLSRQIVDIVTEDEFGSYIRDAGTVLDKLAAAFVTNVPALWAATEPIAQENLNRFMDQGAARIRP